MPDPDTGELIPADVAAFTNGRLDAEDERVADMLASALADARAFCGWHVTPVRSETVVLDGPGSPLLVLPTLRIVDLTAVVEDGSEVDVSTLAWSTRGLIRKKSGAWWSGQFGAITVEFEHGIAAPDAAGWQRAVLSHIDRTSLDVGGPDGRRGLPTKVGPFEWADPESEDYGSVFSKKERAALELFRLEKAP